MKACTWKCLKTGDCLSLVSVKYMLILFHGLIILVDAWTRCCMYILNWYATPIVRVCMWSCYRLMYRKVVVYQRWCCIHFCVCLEYCTHIVLACFEWDTLTCLEKRGCSAMFVSRTHSLRSDCIYSLLWQHDKFIFKSNVMHEKIITLSSVKRLLTSLVWFCESAFDMLVFQIFKNPSLKVE